MSVWRVSLSLSRGFSLSLLCVACLGFEIFCFAERALFVVQNFISRAGAARVVPREREREGLFVDCLLLLPSLSLSRSFLLSLFLFSFEFDKKIGLIFPEEDENAWLFFQQRREEE
jgi:hypothetical protein